MHGHKPQACKIHAFSSSCTPTSVQNTRIFQLMHTHMCAKHTHFPTHAHPHLCKTHAFFNSCTPTCVQNTHIFLLMHTHRRAKHTPAGTSACFAIDRLTHMHTRFHSQVCTWQQYVICNTKEAHVITHIPIHSYFLSVPQTHLHIHLLAAVHTVSVHRHTCTHTQTHVHTHTHMYTQTHTHTHTCTQTQKPIHKCATHQHSYTNIHIHTPAGRSACFASSSCWSGFEDR